MAEESVNDILTTTAERLLAKRIYHKGELEQINKALELLKQLGINTEAG